VLLAADRNHDFVHVPLVVRPRAIPPDAICKVSTKAIDPKPDRFSQWSASSLEIDAAAV
jgi:hypothetical protein